MKPLRLRTRLTAWYTFVLAVVLAIFALTVTWQQGRIGLRRVDRQLDDLTATLSGLLLDELGEKSSPEEAARDVEGTLAATGREVAIVDGAGRVLASGARGGSELSRQPVPAGEVRTWATTTADGSWRVGGRREVLGGRAYILLAAAPMAEADRERREAREAMWLGIPLLVLLAAAGGFWLAAVALRPITVMAGRAAALPSSGGDNLGDSGRDDELGLFERAFNGLLARLRTTLEAQRQFMADAAHELRTPVSVMRSVTDVTLDRPHRDEEEYREALTLIGGQTQQVGHLLEDMLMLARADAGGYPLRPESLYLDELVQACGRSLQGLAAERGVTVRVSAPVELPFVGDEELLRRMVVNLLQNAVQHTAPGGVVTVAVGSEPGTVSVVVTDQGPGIPEGDRARIFDRFVQLDPARRRAGAGLGLPISRWIAEAHGGSLKLRASSPLGSTFVATFPGTALQP